MEKRAATPEDLEKYVKALSYPSSWKTTGTFGAIIASLPRIGGNPPVRVISGREEEMLNAVGISTAFTTGLSIAFTEKFLRTLTPMGLVFVLLHECGHVAFRHMQRRRGRDPFLWNIIGDIQINRVLLHHIMPALAKTGHITGDLLFVDDALGIGLTPDTERWMEKYGDMTEEEIYYTMEEELTQKLKEQKKQKNQQNQNGQGQSGSGGGSGQGGGKGNSGRQPQKRQGSSVGDSPEAGLNDAFDDHVVDPNDLRKKLEEQFGEEGKKLAQEMGLPMDNEQAKELADATKSLAARARGLSSSANRDGKGIGSHVDSFVDDAVRIDENAQAKLNWEFDIQGLIYDAMVGMWTEDDRYPDEMSEWSQIPELREEMGIAEMYRPDLRRKGKVANVVVIMDTSGSVSVDEMKMFLTEIRSMLSASKMDLVVVCADTCVRNRAVFSHDDLTEFPLAFPISGGGGTDMCTPLAQELADAQRPIDVAVVFSDGGFYAFTKDDLLKVMTQVNPNASLNVPPIVMVNSNPHFDSRSLNDAARTFGDGMFKQYVLREMKGPEDISVTGTSLH